MKLDRNLNADGRGKYGLIKNRVLANLTNHDGSGRAANRLFHVRAAIAVLEREGLIDWGDTIDTEFFVIKLRDKFSGAALHEYAISAAREGEREYAMEVRALADRACRHPNHKVPD